MLATAPRPVGGAHHLCQFTLMVSRIAAGFPSLAEDYIEKRIDLNTQLIQHKGGDLYPAGFGLVHARCV
jgi:DNA polymerase V